MLEIDEGRPPIQLPTELLFMITKPIEDADRVSLALSGTFDGFASFYDTKWNKKEITVIYKYHFLTGPSSWERYLTQHIFFPVNITSFSANNCYWIPADILYQVITKMENLTELGVKDTEVNFSHLAKVLRTCQKITKLDISYREKNWYELKRSLAEDNNMMDAIICGFKKLTCLKIATCSHDARDYLNDPWLLIIRILSWCRDCTDLTVEVTYSGSDDCGDREEELALSPAVQRIKKCVQNELFAKMDWVVNLRSLVLVKYGLFANVFPACKNLVNSRLLDQLLELIFSESRKPMSLRRLWIQDFVTRTAVINIWSPPHPMTTYVLDGKKGVHLDHDIDAASDMSWFVHSNIAITPNERFNHLEHLALVRVGEPLPHHPRGYLPNLKYARVSCQNDDGCRQILDEFLLTHPTLEFLHVDFCYASYYVPLISDSVFKLSKLRVLIYDIYEMQSPQNRQNIVEALANYCPNLEVLQLTRPSLGEENDEPMDVAFLSGCRFPKLTTLILRGRIQMNDGAFLVQMIRHCPKLKRLRMSVLFDPITFFPNFDTFLKSAVKLRDLGLTSSMKAGGQHFLTIIKSIRKFSPDLERLFLADTELPVGCPAFQQPGDMETTIVEFALEMKHLVALVLGFPNNFPSSRMNDICSMMMNEVSPRRPALWYWVCLDRDIPTPVDPNVPFIHNHEMILPCFYPPPL